MAAACGPEDFETVNGDDSPVALLYETQYDINNNSAGEPADTQLDLPAITMADKGRCIWIYTCYQNDPNDIQNFGHGFIKPDSPGSGDAIKINGGISFGPLDLFVNDDSLKLYHDGVDTWYFGN